MQKSWLNEIFNTERPIIAMCHLQPLQGDPYYSGLDGIEKVIDAARNDLLALQEGGVDAIMFSNEFSMPYLLKVEPITIAVMARIIGELMDEITIPFGVDVLWDPFATLDLAVAVGAKFVREIFSRVYASDFGLWNTNFGEVVRHKQAIGGENIKLLFNIVPEAAVYLSKRNIVDITRSTVFNHQPDALCVSGLTAGVETDISLIETVKKVAPETKVFANTGVNIENVKRQLSIADGAVVGSTFKFDGVFENSVDSKRVKAFMKKVKDFR